MPTPLTRCLLPALTLLLAACGGGGGAAPPPADAPEVLEIALGQYGTRTGTVVSVEPEPPANDPSAGDTAANLERRAVLRFPIMGIPPSATLLSAQFRAEETLGPADVFTTLGGLVLEAVNAGAVLDVEADFTGPALAGLQIVLSVPPGPANAVRVVSVTAMLQAARQSGLESLDLRLRPQLPAGTDNDGLDDLRRWNVIAPVGGVGPVLVVTYQP